MNAGEVADRVEIDDLLTAYATALDTRDWEGVRAVFTDDAVLDYTEFGGPRGPVDEAVTWISESLAAIPVTQHFVTNRVVEIDGDEAAAVCALFNPIVTPDGAVSYVGGSYEDRLVRTPAGWRITERVARMKWADGVEVDTPR